MLPVIVPYAMFCTLHILPCLIQEYFVKVILYNFNQFVTLPAGQWQGPNFIRWTNASPPVKFWAQCIVMLHHGKKIEHWTQIFFSKITLFERHVTTDPFVKLSLWSVTRVKFQHVRWPCDAWPTNWLKLYCMVPRGIKKWLKICWRFPTSRHWLHYWYAYTICCYLLPRAALWHAFSVEVFELHLMW